jgi:hypothetical protein
VPVLAPEQIVALVVATSFAAGLNLPATIATLGLLERAGVVALPASLLPLASWWVIGASAALFAIEFVADKIPGFDLVWNVLQTFVRVPAGAVLGYAATVQLPPELQLLATIGGGTIALLAHGGKLAARAAVTASPEPFSNFALSTAEDVFAVFITWFATSHPYWAAAIVIAFLAVIAIFARLVFRAIGGLFRRGQRGGSPDAGSTAAVTPP